MPGSGKAFVTLLTSPSYLPGVLVLLHSLLNLHPAPRDFQIVCLVTPETVDAKTIGELRNAGFDLVVGVEGIGSGKAGQDGLSLMGRPDLNLALTKLHIFRLSPLFHTVIYLDADVLPLRPLSHLFDTTAPHVLSASPDTGWPDCFNSGVLVVRPRESDWEGLRGLLKNGEGDQGIYAEKDGSGNGSFDGADQGLLNEWFSEEGGGGAWNRLSFTYNVTPSAAYQYAPAYKRYGNKINAVHFIGKSKPWSNLLYRPAGISNVKGKEGVFDYPTLIDRWYAIYDAHVRPTAAHNPDVSRRFTVPEHQAIWNTTSTGAPQQPVDRLDLDALKAATALGVLSLKQGQYTSLPLDGRVDLIMPKPQPKPAKSVRFNDGQEGAASSVPAHYQPPQAQEPPADHAPSASSPDPSASQPPLDSAPAPMPVEQQFERPAIWDAQRYSPPAGSLPEMGNSTIEFYQNAWDAPASHQGQYYYQQQSHAQQREPEYPTLPANVVQDQWYQQFTSSVPDRSAVQAVFPWEGKQRQATRVFPRGSTPPPLHDQHKPNVAPDLSVQSATPPFSSSQQQQQQRTPDAAPPPPPVRSMAEAMASYTNAWDHDDSIKRYMSRITGVPLPSTKKDSKSMYDAGLRSVPPTPSTAQLKRLDSHVSHDTRSSASGDGDDEDEGDDYEDDDDDASREGRGPSGEPRSPRVSMRRYREKQRTYSNSGGAESSTSPNPRYRDKQAQTDRQHMQDVGLQVNDPVNSPTARTFTSTANSGSSGMKDQGSGSHMPMPMPLPTKKRDAAKPTRSSGSDTPTATSPYASTTRSSAPPASAANATQTQPASSVPRRIPFPVQQPSTDRVPQRARQQSSNIGAHSFHPSSGTGIGLGSSPGQGSQDTSSPTSVVSNLPTGLPPRSSIDSVRSSSSVSPTAGASPPLPLSPLGGGQGSGNGTGNGNGNGSWNAQGRRRESQDVAPSAVDASGMPSVRASRHFAPETDIGVRKGQTLEVLQRLMRGSGNGSGQ